MPSAAAALGIWATALLAPAAYAVDTIRHGLRRRRSASRGPSSAVRRRPGRSRGPGFVGGGFPGGGFPGGGPGGFGGGLATGAENAALLDYLVANRGNAAWIVAANSAQEAGTIELATGLPVMAMGGFTGSDPTPTLDQLKSYVASGELRFILEGGVGGGGFGGFGGSDTTDRTSWVTSTCKVVDYGDSSSNLYDCAGAA